MPSTRYVIETGTVVEGAWQAGGFHEAINAPDGENAVESVRPTLTAMGYRDEHGDHVRVLDPDKREVKRLPLDEAFWSA